MIKIIKFLLLLISMSLHGESQQLQLIPGVGSQFHGISYISKGDEDPSDFEKSIPNFEVTLGADIKYKTKGLTHLLSIQSIALGPSFVFKNIYKDKGILPYSDGHRSVSSIGQALISYGLERETLGKSRIKFHYAAQAGIGLNKSKDAYDSVLAPYSFGWQIGEFYEGYVIHYKRSGVGVFLSGKAGVGLYNKRRKNTFNLQLFWHQGLIKMAEYSIHYAYGYFSHPEYQRSQQVLLKTRGTVFGMTIGMPIGILNNRQQL